MFRSVLLFYTCLYIQVPFLSERRDSNPRPRPWQGRALPTELLSQYPIFKDLSVRRLTVTLPRSFPYSEATFAIETNLWQSQFEATKITLSFVISKKIELEF